MTGGFDMPVEWNVPHREILRRNDAYVGVSIQKVGIEGGPRATRPELAPLKKADPKRYGRLSHPGDAYAYDIIFQAGRLVKDAAASKALARLKGRDQSWSACSHFARRGLVHYNTLDSGPVCHDKSRGEHVLLLLSLGESMNGALQFPSDWPPDCPPSDAVVPNRTVYRTVKADPPADDDFITYHEEGKEYPPQKKCKAASLSVFLSLNDALHHRISHGWRVGAGLIAEGKLTPDLGLFKQTPSKNYASHSSWWPYLGVNRSAVFQVVRGV